jgi:hypothetical protein
MTDQVPFGHLIKVRYSGPKTRGSAWNATWEGFDDDRQPVQRRFEYVRDRDTIARAVAASFLLWMNHQKGEARALDSMMMSDERDGFTLIVRTRSVKAKPERLYTREEVLALMRGAFIDGYASGTEDDDSGIPYDTDDEGEPIAAPASWEDRAQEAWEGDRDALARILDDEAKVAAEVEEAKAA